MLYNLFGMSSRKSHLCCDIWRIAHKSDRTYTHQDLQDTGVMFEQTQTLSLMGLIQSWVMCASWSVNTEILHFITTFYTLLFRPQAYPETYALLKQLHRNCSCQGGVWVKQTCVSVLILDLSQFFLHNIGACMEQY